MKNVPTNFRNLKIKVDKLDVDKLAPVPVDLSKLSDVVKNYVVKKDVYNAKVKNVQDKIPDITNLATNTTLNAKINEAENKIPSITNLAITTALNSKINEVKKITKLLLMLLLLLKIEILNIRKNIFACLCSVHNTISLSCHEQKCLMRLHFERYFSHHWTM